MIVLEILHLKMEVTVSEPCNVIRVAISMKNMTKLPVIQHVKVWCFSTATVQTCALAFVICRRNRET